MFVKTSPKAYREPLPGIRYKTLAFGEKTHLTEFRLEKGRDLPDHAHPHEQTGYLVSGYLKLRIGDETFDARPGDSWSVPGNVTHGAFVVEDTVAIEVFSPIREDYLPTGDEMA